MKLLPSISKSSEYFTALTTESLENVKTNEMRNKEINWKKKVIELSLISLAFNFTGLHARVSLWEET